MTPELHTASASSSLLRINIYRLTQALTGSKFVHTVSPPAIFEALRIDTWKRHE